MKKMRKIDILRDIDARNIGVVGQEDTPRLSAREMQLKVEEVSRDVIIPVINGNAEIFDEFAENTAADLETKATQADVDVIRGDLSSHVSDEENPHHVTAAQVGAEPARPEMTQVQAEAGTDTAIRGVTAQRIRQAINAVVNMVRISLDNHIAATQFELSSQQLGLNAQQLALSSHVSDQENPHQVTAEQVGAVSRSALDDLAHSTTARLFNLESLGSLAGTYATLQELPNEIGGFPMETQPSVNDFAIVFESNAIYRITSIGDGRLNWELAGTFQGGIDEEVRDNTVRIANQDGGFAAGRNAQAHLSGVAIGSNASASNDCIAIGNARAATDSTGIAIGYHAVVQRMEPGEGGIQLGTGENEDSRTLQVYDFTLMNADGTIPSARIPQLGDISTALTAILGV